MMAGQQHYHVPSTPSPRGKALCHNPWPDQQEVQPPRTPHSTTLPPPPLAPVSARKLAASMWESQGTFLSKAPRSRRHHRRSPAVDGRASRTREKIRLSSSTPQDPPSVHYKLQEDAKRWPQSEKSGDNMGDCAESYQRHSPMPVEASLKGLSCGSATTNEVLKVLSRVRNFEQQQASNRSLVADLRAELDHNHSQMQELILRDKCRRQELEKMTNALAKEKMLWQKHEGETIHLAVLALKKELEEERRSKQRLETAHRRVAKELHEVQKTLVKVLEDAGRERKARELMEDVCDELAREIGEDKARVEEMTRESVKVREEVEEERRMLQMAEIWREERVQMKLMEAKLELEEKNSALEKLRTELESFLKAKRAGNAKNGGAGMLQEARQDASPNNLVYVKESGAFGTNRSSEARPNVYMLGESSSGFSSTSREDDRYPVELENETSANYGMQGRSERRRRRIDKLMMPNSTLWQVGPFEENGQLRSSQVGVMSESNPPWEDVRVSQWLEQNTYEARK